MDKLQMTMNKPIDDHDQTLARTPTIHVGKILQIQGVFTEQQSVFFSNILKEVHPYFTDRNIFALLFLSIVLNNDASRGLQKTCQYFIQRLLGQKYKRQNAEEMLGFIKTKIIFLTNYLSETTKGFSSWRSGTKIQKIVLHKYVEIKKKSVDVLFLKTHLQDLHLF